MTVLDDILSQIAGVDSALDIARKLWLDAENDEERVKYRVKLDGLLDQRLPLMARRDQILAFKAA